MFLHIMFGINNLDKAKAFYDAVLDKHRIFWRTPTGVLSASLFEVPESTDEALQSVLHKIIT